MDVTYYVKNVRWKCKIVKNAIVNVIVDLPAFGVVV